MDFDFTKAEYQRICEEAMLKDLQKQILEDKILGLTIIEISMKRHKSPETIKRETRKMKRKILKVI